MVGIADLLLTSDNDIIDDMSERNPDHRKRLALWMNGEMQRVNIYKRVNIYIKILYRDLQRHPETIWSFILYTGYLKAIRLYKKACAANGVWYDWLHRRRLLRIEAMQEMSTA